MPLTLNGTTGEIFPSWTTAGRPSTPTAGQTGYNSTLNILETYNGSTWCPFVTTATTFAGNGPAFRAYASASQTVTLSTATKVNIDTTVFDTASCFDTTNKRFTPTVAGYYQINGILVSTAATTFTQASAFFYKNGAVYVRGPAITASLTAGGGTTLNIYDIVYLNGSTDYVELWGQVNGSGTAQFVFTSTTISSFFSGALVRAA
jgi:hypothetical protein